MPTTQAVDTNRPTHCHTCGAAFPTLQPGHCGGTGYGYDKDRHAHCYKCCGERERKAMIETGRACLYLSQPTMIGGGFDSSKAKVTDWPGTLSFRVISCYRIRHNMARHAYAVRFVGPDGYVWSGRNIGDNQILRANRTKDRA